MSIVVGGVRVDPRSKMKIGNNGSALSRYNCCNRNCKGYHSQSQGKAGMYCTRCGEMMSLENPQFILESSLVDVKLVWGDGSTESKVVNLIDLIKGVIDANKEDKANNKDG